LISPDVSPLPPTLPPLSPPRGTPFLSLLSFLCFPTSDHWGLRGQISHGAVQAVRIPCRCKCRVSCVSPPLSSQAKTHRRPFLVPGIFIASQRLNPTASRHPIESRRNVGANVSGEVPTRPAGGAGKLAEVCRYAAPRTRGCLLTMAGSDQAVGTLH